MRIDVHAHYFPDEYVNYIARILGTAAADPGRRAPGTHIDLDERFALMDSAGIDMQVLSASALHPYAEDRGDAVTGARLANDLYADVCRRYPARFAAFGAVPLPHVDAALAEVERCLDQLGFVGITTGCSVAGRPLDDPAFEPFWAELDRRGCVLFLHPMGMGFGGELAAYNLDWMIGAPFEDSVAAMRLVLSGITTRYPRICVIVPHLGGTLPFLMGRIGHNTASQRAEAGRPAVHFAGTLRENLRRLWYDTVNHEPTALQCACAVLGADRLLLGTDFPYAIGDRFRGCVRYVEAAGLSAAETEAILGGTAQAMLGLSRRDGPA
jgi:aminocarboxymuconate-semialdehyde decarboxylase